jgi:class 3 adenylate cyclase
MANAEALAAAGELVVSPSVYYSLMKTRKNSSIASKLVFTNVGSELGLGWESEFHRVSWSDHSTSADVMLNYFKDRDGTSNRKRDNAQSLINNVVKNTYSMSDEDVVSFQDNLMRLLENHRHEAARDVVGRFTAELRRVVVLFMSISIEPSLPEKPSDDKFLLDNLQSIYSILTESVSSRSGQIRQFIYDDKGTVLIASFGLRGSVLLNAADIALGAAQEAQSKLLDIMDVQCSIGITLGNIFCGETGSPQRYEYSLLGPEVNLAARLMAKSKPGQINCDEEFKNQTGQKQTFTISGTHKLKGYTKPVPFFMPVQYRSDVEYDEQDDIASFLMQKVVGLGLVCDIVKKRGLMCNMMKHRVIIIKGDEVTGKEAFMSGILKELSVNSTSVILEANRCFHDEPFYSFVPIITKAILSFASARERLLLLKKSHKRSSVLSSFLANDALKANAFPSWAKMVPDHLIPYLSLVNDFIYRGFPILKSSSEATLLKDGEKVEKCAEVLCALIIRFLELRQSHGIISIPEVDSLDLYSKKLLRQILSSEENLLLIGGVDDSFSPCDEQDTTNNILASILGNELDLEVELINLDLLDVKSTFDLFTWSLRRDFTRDELDIIHQSEVLDKIFAICGGVPHATTGLANSFCSQFKKQFHDLGGERTVNLLEFTQTFLDDTPTDLHEIICYRFDQMKLEEQMLLKVCSVAGFGKYSFSQNLLENVVLGISRGEGEENFIMEDHDDYDNESGNNDHNESGMGVLSVLACDVPFSAVASEDSGYLNYMLQGDNFKELLGM